MLSYQSPSGAAKTGCAGCVASPNACAGRFVRLRRRSAAGRQDRLSDRDVGGGNESAGNHHAEPHYVSASHSHGDSKPDWYSHGGTHRYGSPDEDPHGYCHHNIDAGHRDEDRHCYSDSNTDADLDSHHDETGTATATATRTRTLTPTTTATGTAMPTAIRSATPTATPSATRVATPTPTARPSPTHTSSATLTPPASPTSIPVRTSWRVPILMYHYIRVNPDPSDRLGFSLSIPPAEFDRQMRYLAEDGYGTVSFDQIYDSSQPLPEKPILLTFDDGYADAYTAAFPVLQRYGFQATFYVVTDFVGRPGYLTVEQIREMAAAGMSFGSHSVSHLSLTTLSAERLERELSQSRTQLESLLERQVLDLCYPLGRFNQPVRQAVERAGYRSATTTEYGFASSGGDQLLLPRIRIWGGLILRNFASLIAGE